MKREFDAKLRKVGNSFVVTVPASIIKRFKLKENEFLTVSIVKREFDAKLRKVGNSFVVTVQASIIRKFKLKENRFVTASIEVNNEN